MPRLQDMTELYSAEVVNNEAGKYAGFFICQTLLRNVEALAVWPSDAL